VPLDLKEIQVAQLDLKVQQVLQGLMVQLVRQDQKEFKEQQDLKVLQEQEQQVLKDQSEPLG
jgi:hypothetical protein